MGTRSSCNCQRAGGYGRRAAPILHTFAMSAGSLWHDNHVQLLSVGVCMGILWLFPGNVFQLSSTAFALPRSGPIIIAAGAAGRILASRRCDIECQLLWRSFKAHWETSPWIAGRVYATSAGTLTAAHASLTSDSMIAP